MLVLVIIQSFNGVSSECPAPALFKPCVCKDNGIICGGHSDIDLVNIFQTLEKNLKKSEKHFDSLYLNNTSINELKENTFKDITFDQIRIEDCNNLSKIHINAFLETDLVTSILILHSNPALSSTDNSIFNVFSKFVNLEELVLEYNNITEIPSNAFQRITGYQKKLESLTFCGKSFKKIGSRPFSLLKGLRTIMIFGTSLSYIPEYAFDFENDSDQQLKINFAGNKFLNGSSFQQDSLSHFKRPVHLDLSGEQIEYLDENIFKNFLNSNPHNEVDMSSIELDCDNCKNFWLTKHAIILKRISFLECANKKKLDDPDNFAECGPFASLKPCMFIKNESRIYCGNHQMDLKAIFHNFSKQLSDNEKHFKNFSLVNDYIKVLEENTFDEITFDEIEIKECENLKFIDRYAFNGTDLSTQNLSLALNPKLAMDNTIYDILSSFPKMDSIYLEDIGFKEIPSKAFRPINGYQNKLRILYIMEDITKIGNHSFSSLKNLSFLELNIGKLVSFPDYAFEFEEYSDQPFNLVFILATNFSPFNEKTLLNIRRPTKIVFAYMYNAYFLEEKVFLPFFLDNPKNTI